MIRGEPPSAAELVMADAIGRALRGDKKKTMSRLAIDPGAEIVDNGVQYKHESPRDVCASGGVADTLEEVST